MLQNASLLAIVAVDTEENEPIKNEVWWVRRHFLEPRFLEEAMEDRRFTLTKVIELVNPRIE